MTFTATTNPKKPEETEAQITSEAVKWRTICNYMKKGFQKNNYGFTGQNILHGRRKQMKENGERIAVTISRWKRKSELCNVISILTFSNFEDRGRGHKLRILVASRRY